MIKKIIFILMLFVTIIHSAQLHTNKNVYGTNERIDVSLTELNAQPNEWVAIFPAGNNNDFGNIVQWQLTGGMVEADLQFAALRAGEYDIRLFLGANPVNGASKQIRVEHNGEENGDTEINTNKEVYEANEQVVVNYENMSGNNHDWIGIYPANSNNDWGNVVQWTWVNEQVVGNHAFNGLPAGVYEARAFFNNSFNLEASSVFRIEEGNNNTAIRTNKEVYQANEQIVVNYENMLGNDHDWIGIYPANSNNDWGNVVQWAWTNGEVNGNHNFQGLAGGEYEVRAFFNDSFNLEASSAFRVEVDNGPTRILYDDFEDGIDPRWVRHSGRAMTLLNVGAIDKAVGHTERQVQVNGQHSLRTYLGGGYYFPFNQPDVRYKFLELDMKIGVSSHRFNFGVKVRTALGTRKIEFSSWLNHTLPNGRQIIRGPYGNVLQGHSVAFTTDNYIHLHPAPSDFYVGTSGIGGGQNMFVHYKIDIEEKLKVLEPNNELLEILAFSVNGGDYDNLALSRE